MSLSQLSPKEPRSILMINQLWFADELRAKGHHVVTLGPHLGTFDVQLEQGGMPINTVYERLPRGFSPDCIIYYDNSCPPTVIGLEELDCLSIFFSVDAHHHYSWHSIFGSLFDLVLVAHRDYIPYFLTHCSEVRWFPLWAPVDLEPEREKVIDIAFRGNLDPKLHPERAKFFALLGAEFSVDAQMGDYAKVYTKAKIVVNQAVKKDLNFRVFEAMMAGALLVTPKIENGLCDLFTPDEEIVTYEDGNAKDAARVIRYYLENEKERVRIANNGHQKILKLHTKSKRGLELEELILSRKTRDKKQKYLASALIYLYSSMSFQKVSLKHTKEYVVYAARNILSSIIEEEPHSEDFLHVVLRIMYRLDELMLFEENAAFTNAIIEAYPKEALFKAARVASLVERGSLVEAEKYAKEYSENSDHYLQEVPIRMDELKQELLKIPLSL